MTVSMTTAQAWAALSDLDGRALFMSQRDYERENDRLMAIVAADPDERGAAVTLWRLGHPGATG